MSNCLYKLIILDHALWSKVKAISKEILPSLMPSQLLCDDPGHVLEILWVSPVFLLALVLTWEILRHNFSDFLKSTRWLRSLLPLKQFVSVANKDSGYQSNILRYVCVFPQCRVT